MDELERRLKRWGMLQLEIDTAFKELQAFLDQDVYDVMPFGVGDKVPITGYSYSYSNRDMLITELRFLSRFGNKVVQVEGNVLKLSGEVSRQNTKFIIPATMDAINELYEKSEELKCRTKEK